MLWYDECVLRFSDRLFFDTVSYRPGVFLLMGEEVKVNAKEDFRKRLEKLMDESSREVENSAKRFLTKEIEFTDFETIYSLMQCTPDLSGGDCTACLAEAIERLSICCAGSLGGGVLLPSCAVRYHFHLFYENDTNCSADVLELPPPPWPTGQ